jgi:hypothetical protein
MLDKILVMFSCLLVTCIASNIDAYYYSNGKNYNFVLSRFYYGKLADFHFIFLQISVFYLKFTPESRGFQEFELPQYACYTHKEC